MITGDGYNNMVTNVSFCSWKMPNYYFEQL